MNSGERKVEDASLCASDMKTHAHGAVVAPIYQSSTFVFEDTAQVAAFARGESDRYQYTRYGNPTIKAAEEKLAALERGARAFLFASGSAATAAWCYAGLRPGDRLVASDQLYGGTLLFLERCIRPIGVEIDLIDFTDLDRVAESLAGAKACWFETPTNPTVRLIDGMAVAGLCRQHGVSCAVDNTFATPINQKPLSWGVDWVMYSVTKYLNGHDDVIGGVLVAALDTDTRPVEQMRQSGGGIMDPHAAFLLSRGLKTLALRVERQNDNAMAVAEHLLSHEKIARIHYPGLASHPGHEIARCQMRGFGGMLAFDVAGENGAAARFVDRLSLIKNAASLGGVESLISLPVLTSHAHATPEQCAAAQVTEATVRLSVGIEAIGDLIADIDEALQGI